MRIAVLPEGSQIEELLTSTNSGPVVMLNLLRFKESADDGSGSGVDAYRRYATRMKEIVEGAGGRFLWSGRIDSQVIGESDVAFDMVGLVEYPSRQAFLTIASSPEVEVIGADRKAGLEGQWLIACSESGL